MTDPISIARATSGQRNVRRLGARTTSASSGGPTANGPGNADMGAEGSHSSASGATRPGSPGDWNVFYFWAVDFDDTPEEAAFRAEARAWLEANAVPKGDPGDFSAGIWSDDIGEDLYIKRCKEWQAQLYDAGWAGITWPKRFGGRGGKPIEGVIWNQEQARFGVSVGIFMVAHGMVAPTLMAHGTEEQQARWLDPMLRGDDIWCQLFSEPGAGSDLAALSTKAVRDGDEWVVTGQKVWTSSAHRSQWGILLARTNRDGAEAQGHHLLRARHGHAGHRHPAAAADDGRRALQRGVPRRGAHPGRERASARSTRAGPSR